MSAEVVSINSTKETVVADLNNGYTRIANELIDQLCRVDLSGRQFRVVNAIIRKTYGYRKKQDWITAGQIAEEMEYDGATTNISADIRTLRNRNVLFLDGRKIGVNTRLSDWIMTKKPRSKTITKVIENDQFSKKPTNQKQSHKELKTITSVIENDHNLDQKRSPQKKKENYKETIKENSPSENTPTQVEVKKSLLEKVQLKNPQAVIATKKGQAVSWGEQTDLDLAKQIHAMAITITHDEKEPNWASWANDIRLMREQDNRTDQQILALFTFTNQDSFWAANVLCPGKLRERWGQLAAKYNQQRAERTITQDGQVQKTAQGNSQSTATATLEQLTDNDW
tara:strand:+ start:7292 stop:8311 length:1020 start_codon:yes stop_codon:yes gene_type:complete